LELIFVSKREEDFITKRLFVEAASKYSVLSCLITKKGEELEIRNTYRGCDTMKLFPKDNTKELSW